MDEALVPLDASLVRRGGRANQRAGQGQRQRQVAAFTRHPPGGFRQPGRRLPGAARQQLHRLDLAQPLQRVGLQRQGAGWVGGQVGGQGSLAGGDQQGVAAGGEVEGLQVLRLPHIVEHQQARLAVQQLLQGGRALRDSVVGVAPAGVQPVGQLYLPRQQVGVLPQVEPEDAGREALGQARAARQGRGQHAFAAPGLGIQDGHGGGLTAHHARFEPGQQLVELGRALQVVRRQLGHAVQQEGRGWGGRGDGEVEWGALAFGLQQAVAVAPAGLVGGVPAARTGGQVGWDVSLAVHTDHAGFSRFGLT